MTGLRFLVLKTTWTRSLPSDWDTGLPYRCDTPRSTAAAHAADASMRGCPIQPAPLAQTTRALLNAWGRRILMRPPFAALAALFALSACQMPLGGTAQRPAPVPSGGGGQATIVLSGASVRPGQTATVTATLQTGGASIAGTQNDITFDPRAVAIARKANGKPDCRANGALGKEGTAFNFLPQKCAPGSCDTVRALVLSLSNVAAIANGSVLYTCTVEVAGGAAPGAQALRLSRVGFSDPSGKAISGRGVDGTVTVGK
jgi:hypothetical protein